jgi:hypothetical protein
MRRGHKAAPEAIVLPRSPSADAHLRQEVLSPTLPIINSVRQQAEVDTAHAQRVTTIKQALADRSYDISSSDVADKVVKHYAQVRADMALLRELISPTALAPTSVHPKDPVLLLPRDEDATGEN